MPDSRKKMPAASIGSSLLLVIFLILCLVMFATLSVTTARSNYLQSQREAARLTEKTEADNTSTEVLSQISTLLSDAAAAEAKNVTDSSETNASVSDTAEGDHTEAVSSAIVSAQTSAGTVSVTILTLTNGHTRLSWQIPFSDNHALAVTIDLADAQFPEAYTITQWQTLQTGEWSLTDTIKVMTP